MEKKKKSCVTLQGKHYVVEVFIEPPKKPYPFLYIEEVFSGDMKPKVFDKVFFF